MAFLIPVLLIVVLIIAVASVIAFFATSKFGAKMRSGKPIGNARTKEEAVREANRRLSKNPRDPGSLDFLANYYFDEHDWENAFRMFETLTDIPPTDGAYNQTKANLHAAISAMELNNLESAHKFLAVAHSLDATNPDINYQLGMLEFRRMNYEKAAQSFQHALSYRPEHSPTLRGLGHALFKLKRPKDAMGYIRRAMESAPNDKESLFTLAECYTESGQREQALRIYSHLRPDEVWGAQACLASGIIKVESHQDAEAITDFEIGLKHQEIKTEIELELNYQLAAAYIRSQDISTAMNYLSQTKMLRDGYKDVNDLIYRYKELSANKNLQIFTMSPSADFVALCRKIVMTHFTKAKVKITKTSVSGNDWADILAEVDTPKWSNIVMFRFIRTQGAIGELVLRDFHSKLKEAKADKGVCMGVGNYSDEAKRFTEARLIDLVDREKLTALLNTVDSKLLAISPKRPTA